MSVGINLKFSISLNNWAKPTLCLTAGYANAIEKHAQYTKSQKAIEVLANWDRMVPKFVKVMLRDYKRVLQAIQNALASGLSGDDALDAAFEENSRDVARIMGS